MSDSRQDEEREPAYRMHIANTGEPDQPIRMALPAELYSFPGTIGIFGVHEVVYARSDWLAIPERLRPKGFDSACGRVVLCLIHDPIAGAETPGPAGPAAAPPGPSPGSPGTGPARS